MVSSAGRAFQYQVQPVKCSRLRLGLGPGHGHRQQSPQTLLTVSMSIWLQRQVRVSNAGDHSKNPDASASGSCTDLQWQQVNNNQLNLFCSRFAAAQAHGWLMEQQQQRQQSKLTQELYALLSASMSHADNKLTNRRFGMEKLTKEKLKGQRKCSESNYICNNRADSAAAENLWLKRHRNMTLALGQQRGRAGVSGLGSLYRKAANKTLRMRKAQRPKRVRYCACIWSFGVQL